MKICSKCKSEKELKYYFKDKRTNDGYYPICKCCKNEMTKRYHKTKEGLITKIYAQQRFVSKKRGHDPPNYSKQQLKYWIFNHNDFDKLHLDWVNSDFSKDLKPSCDRKDDYLPYTFDNLDLVTWKQNHERIYSDMKNGINNKQSKAVLQFTKQGVFIKEFYSTAQAGRELNHDRSNISACCNGNLRSAYGFMWRYKKTPSK